MEHRFFIEILVYSLNDTQSYDDIMTFFLLLLCCCASKTHFANKIMTFAQDFTHSSYVIFKLDLIRFDNMIIAQAKPRAMMILNNFVWITYYVTFICHLVVAAYFYHCYYCCYHYVTINHEGQTYKITMCGSIIMSIVACSIQTDTSNLRL